MSDHRIVFVVAGTARTFSRLMLWRTDTTVDSAKKDEIISAPSYDVALRRRVCLLTWSTFRERFRTLKVNQPHQLDVGAHPENSATLPKNRNRSDRQKTQNREGQQESKKSSSIDRQHLFHCCITCSTAVALLLYAKL